MKLHFSFFKNKSLFYNWLLSYAVILFIPVAISNIMFSQAESIVKMEVSRANIALLKQIQQTVDARVREINTIPLQISTSQEVNKYLLSKEPLDQYALMSELDIIKQLKSIHMNNNFIYNLYIFFPASGRFMSSSGAYGEELMYKQIHKYRDISYDDWRNNILNTRHFQNWMPMTITEAKGTPSKMLTLVHTIPIDDIPGPYAQCIVMIDENSIQEIFNNIEWANQTHLFIVDEKNNILTSTLELSKTKLTGDIFPLPSEFSIKELKEEKVFICSIPSETTGWKYVSVIPFNIFMEKVEYIKNITLISILLCMVIGILTSYFLVRKNYKPIREVITSLPEELESAMAQPHNELGLIKNSISALINEKRHISKILQDQKPMMKANLLAKLLKGTAVEDESTIDTMKFTDVNFVSDDFSVIAIDIYDYSSFPVSTDIDKHVMVSIILSNIIEELTYQKHSGYFFELDEYMGCLVNFKPGITAEAAKKNMFEIVSKVQEFAESEYKIYFSAGISNIHRGVTNIPSAYHQVKTCLEYMLITGKIKKIACYDETIHFSHINTYSIQTEQCLVNSVKSGNFEEASGILEKVFDEILQDDGISVPLARCKFFDIMSTVFKAVEGINILDRKTFMEENDYTESLIKCKTLREMQCTINTIFKQICEHVKSSRTSHIDELIQSLVKFIDENYHNSSLSMASIADKFNMNGIYLSTLFKKHIGCTPIQYLNKVRIHHSKELLLEKDNGIADIAAKVGYNNVTTLIRTFKKYEGITPGKYRELHFI